MPTLTNVTWLGRVHFIAGYGHYMDFEVFHGKFAWASKWIKQKGAALVEKPAVGT